MADDQAQNEPMFETAAVAVIVDAVGNMIAVVVVGAAAAVAAATVVGQLSVLVAAAVVIDANVAAEFVLVAVEPAPSAAAHVVPVSEPVDPAVPADRVAIIGARSMWPGYLMESSTS